MFSITFTALSNLLQIKARISMFLCRAPAVRKEGTGGSAWLVSCPTVPVSLWCHCQGSVLPIGMVGWVRSAVPLEEGQAERGSRIHLPQPPRHQHTFYF